MNPLPSFRFPLPGGHLPLTRWPGLAIGTATLLLGSLAALAQAPTITGLSPGRNAVAAPRAAPVALTFSQAMAGATAGNVRVFSAQRGGQLANGGNATVSGNTLTVDPAIDFRPGETVFVTVTNSVLGASGQSATPHVYQFTAAVGGMGRGSFLVPAANPDPSVGQRPYRVTMGDVDGDGDLDLLTANAGPLSTPGTTVSMRLNDGTGSFSGTQEIGVGNRPVSVALGDVDGDGDLDLLTPNDFANTVSVRLNDGTGSFSGTQDVSVGTNPQSVALGDVDADGDLDLLAANRNASTVSVRLNNGSGLFSGTQDVSVGIYPTSTALGDVDGDGDLDLLTTNQGSSSGAGTVSIRRNDGAGSFSGSQEVSVGSLPQSLAVGDVDGDGDLDLLTANYDFSAHTVSVRLNDGTGSFGGTQDVAVGNSPNSVALGDVEADGDLDLLTADFYGNTVSLRLNNGTGTFSGPQDINVGNGPGSVALGDVDRDGDLDLLTTNLDDNTVSVRLNGGTGPTATTPDAAAAAFTLAPNPARAQVRLGGAAAGQPITLLDATGRVVRTVAATLAGATLSVAGLPPGVYVVRAGAQARRLVVE